MAEKVIFLDIDGVLNDAMTETRAPSCYVGIDEDKVKLLYQIVEATGAKIVLTSTWKTEWSKQPEYRTPDGNYLNSKLAAEGLQIFDKTEDKVLDRGTGIKNWLAAHPEVEKWVVLDDEIYRDFKDCGIIPHLVQTPYYSGLTMNHVEKCLEKLNGGIENGNLS